MMLFFKFSFFLGGLIPLFLGIFIYFQNRTEIINKTYAGLSLCCALWSFGFLQLFNSDNPTSAYYWRMLMDIGAVILPAFWMHFLFSVFNLNSGKKVEITVYYVYGLFLVGLNIFDYFNPGVFITKLDSQGIFHYYPVAGPGYYLFIFFYIVVIPYSLHYLVKNYLKSTGVRAQQVKYLIIASLMGFIGGGTAFLLTFDIKIAPYGIILFALYPIIIAYSISKHHLFDIKVIVTEFLTFGIWIFVLARVYLAENLQERFVNGGLLAFLIISGILLIRSVIREVEQRERIEKLAGELDVANARLKEFLGLATHQIRAPIAAIRGYASGILEGDFGPVTPEIHKTVDIISASSAELARTVQDFLDISRIEQGEMKYELTDFDLNDVTRSVIDDLQPTTRKKGLSLTLTLPPHPLMVKADKAKLHQVVQNIVDNATKYTDRGSITLTAEERDGKVLLTVKDTGRGIKPEVIPKLFQKFSRAEDATKANLLGTGQGLYIAKILITAMQGRIWVESGGEGQGSQFYVELPVA